ncbi:predicted protein [Plenodomus lingam JN3]|uniref:Predicted protein n=1 Tax=Leptosphaeria maculans (strain JN3 / isolate v23.1.3 / race Av1-4-5-6-7-8) TaxID=985895 RepID=E4ZU08_LEPMJ|nr:predicted protein [Plenodomus lingam JN3]CBX94718.1 predicted protein [Plenodomus lingam JN3]
MNIGCLVRSSLGKACMCCTCAVPKALSIGKGTDKELDLTQAVGEVRHIVLAASGESVLRSFKRLVFALKRQPRNSVAVDQTEPRCAHENQAIALMAVWKMILMHMDGWKATMVVRWKVECIILCLLLLL